MHPAVRLKSSHERDVFSLRERQPTCCTPAASSQQPACGPLAGVRVVHVRSTAHARPAWTWLRGHSGHTSLQCFMLIIIIKLYYYVDQPPPPPPPAPLLPERISHCDGVPSRAIGRLASTKWDRKSENLMNAHNPHCSRVRLPLPGKGSSNTQSEEQGPGHWQMDSFRNMVQQTGHNFTS